MRRTSFPSHLPPTNPQQQEQFSDADEISSHRASDSEAACDVNLQSQYWPWETFYRQYFKVRSVVLKYNLFSRKRLLIVAGPTGCGKSTFLRSALGNKPSPLTKKILRKAFKRSDFKIQQLYFRRLQKLHEKQESYKKFIRNYNNFILDIDTTGPRFKKNALIFPDFLSKFNRITSVQICTPYDLWINRILERKINSTLRCNRSLRRVLHNSLSLKPQDINQAEKQYYAYFNQWDLILSDYNVKSQIRINTMEDLILE